MDMGGCKVEGMDAMSVPASNRYRLVKVNVQGGHMAMGMWTPQTSESSVGGTPEVVLAIHGITGNHRCWSFLVDALRSTCVLAPDLRGRGGSCGLSGPFGMSAHADDMVRALDAAGIERAVVVGHSMGAFVAAVMADRHADRVTSLVMVDGGMPLTKRRPAQSGRPLKSTSQIGARLDLTFDTKEQAVEFWRLHPALRGDFTPVLRDYAEYDVGGQEPLLQPRATKASLLADSHDIMHGVDHRRALERLTCPARWLIAPRGLLNEQPGLYPQELILHWNARYRSVAVMPVVDVNHYTIVLTRRGGDAIARAVRSLHTASSERLRDTGAEQQGTVVETSTNRL